MYKDLCDALERFYDELQQRGGPGDAGSNIWVAPSLGANLVTVRIGNGDSARSIGEFYNRVYAEFVVALLKDAPLLLECAYIVKILYNVRDCLQFDDAKLGQSGWGYTQGWDENLELLATLLGFKD